MAAVDCKSSVVFASILFLLLLNLPSSQAQEKNVVISATVSVDGLEWVLEPVDKNGSVGSDASISIDPQDRPHIVYIDRTNKALKHAYRSGGSWHIEFVNKTGVVGYAASAQGADGKLHAVYMKGGYHRYAVMENDTWSFRTVPGVGRSCGPNSIAVDSKGDAHILQCFFGSLYHVVWNGSSWFSEPIDERYYTAIASITLDKNDDAHIIYDDLDNEVVRYAMGVSGSWTRGQIGPAIESVNSIVVDSKMVPHVTYRGSQYNDSYAYKMGNSWVRKNLLFTNPWSSLAVNSSDVLHLAFRFNWQLGHAVKNESGWSSEIVDSREDVDQQPSIVIDSLGTPHIAYYDGRHDDLLYATKRPKETSATVDIDPDTLNLGSGGRFVTAYIELEGADVRDIDASSIRLNDVVSPIMDERYGFVISEDSYIVDHDEDGVPERMVKFWRSEVQEIVDVGVSITITLSGKLLDGSPFSGTDTIRVIDPSKLNQPNFAMAGFGYSGVSWEEVAIKVPDQEEVRFPSDDGYRSVNKFKSSNIRLLFQDNLVIR